MGLARGAQQADPEPDWRRLWARSLWVGTRTCYRTVVSTDQPKRAERLGPKGHGPWATGSSSRGMHSTVDPADSTALRWQTNAQQERSNLRPALVGRHVFASRWSAARQVLRWDLPRSQGLG